LKNSRAYTNPGSEIKPAEKISAFEKTVGYFKRRADLHQSLRDAVYGYLNASGKANLGPVVASHVEGVIQRYDELEKEESLAVEALEAHSKQLTERQDTVIGAEADLASNFYSISE